MERITPIKKTFGKLLTNRIFLHILFWIIVYLIFAMLMTLPYKQVEAGITASLAMLVVEIPATYFAIYYLLPKYLLQRKYLKFIFGIVGTVIISILLERFLLIFGVFPLFYDNISQTVDYFFYMPVIVFYPIENGLVISMATIIKLLKFWYKNQHIRTQLENQNMQSELALLRSQINPHFLFNTLNNIDTLIYQNSTKASEAIMKLSEIMRYMLYEANHEKVFLTKEIDYIKSFISLEKLRIRDTDFVDFRVSGEPNGKLISPMVLIPFVENAFKHGKRKATPPGIVIHISINNNNLQLYTKNYISQMDEKRKENMKKGFGLANVKRRLNLVYNENYNLEINEKDNQFIVNLEIQIANARINNFDRNK